jgi:DNA invertase Pin-like site-specific DNA recombinase
MEESHMETGEMKVSYRKSIRESRKTRTAAYCRVSTNRADQEDSFEVQKEYYDKYIQSNPDWEYVGIYSDNGISGTDAKKRPGFMQMVQDAVDGKIDLILVKSISRFSRNVVDCKHYVDLLHGNGVDILFEKEGLSTKDPTAFLMFGLMAVIAQSESESISKNMKWRYQQAFEQGKYSLGNNHILGYSTKHDGTIYINDDAWIVRKIFQMFLAGKSYSAIASAVNAAGGHSVTGRPMTAETVRGILKNETFVGDKLLQKRPPKNFLTHKPDPSVDYDSFYITDGHPAIIDRDTWDQVQKKLSDRKEEQERGIYSMPGRSSFLYGRVFCGNCGALYKRRNSGSGERMHKMWVCMERRKGKKGNGCKNRTVDETELLQAISDELGLPWKDTDAFPREEFECQIEKILVYDDHFEFIKKS